MTALVAYQDESEAPWVGQGRPQYAGRQGLTAENVLAPVDDRLTTSVFGIERTPNWFVPMCNRIKELMKLEPGWDGHDGKPVDSDVANFAAKFLRETLEPDGPVPQVVPLSYGGLQFEWHEKGIDLEIEVEAPNRIFVSFEDSKTDEELEGEFSTDYTEVMHVMRILESRSR